MSERAIQNAIRLALGMEPDLVLWRNNVGLAVQGDGADARRVAYGLQKGSSDLVGILAPHGRFFALELKTPKGRLSADQALWAGLVRKMGGFCSTARSVEEALAALARARMGERQ